MKENPPAAANADRRIFKTAGTLKSVQPAVIYLRYFLFHDFKRRLSLKDNEALLRFIQRLSFDVKKLFYPFELSLIAHYPRVAILYINLTKVRWRLRRYPTWGDKCDLNKINPQYLNW